MCMQGMYRGCVINTPLVGDTERLEGRGIKRGDVCCTEGVFFEGDVLDVTTSREW